MVKFAVIGDPVVHSLSPALHTVVYERLGINVRYDKIHVPKEELRAFAERLRSGKGEGAEAALCGVNVTIPHKEGILPLLDEIKGDASSAGAINTVVREDWTAADRVGNPQFAARLIGYNTDMEGLLRALENSGSGYQNRVVCIFGSGGAALGAAVKAASEGAKTVRVIGRNKEKIDKICERAPTVLSVVAESGYIPAAAVLDADVFINATPLGMQGYTGSFTDFDFLDALPKTALVYDCVYIPAETTLLWEARARGLKAENGLSMLVWQGLLSDVYFLRAAGEERFTKAEILSQEMFAAVYKTLENVLG
ncbi:shikimate dehydrogenase (NADP(+)) [Clostridia bacterium]|nr:shikimate dehydrogenase (NADP(+)) [Clostridia bacterium]